MLEEDLRTAIADANDLGHFFLLMEHMGYEISHGNRLGFRLRGQERFMIPGRKNPLFTEDGIRAAIQGNLAAIEAGRRPAVQLRPQYRPYQKYPRYTGFLALYVHYLYLLGKIGKRQYPPRMTPQLWQEVMRFEQYREQFAFLRDNGITTRTDMAAFTARTEETLANLMKQRTVPQCAEEAAPGALHRFGGCGRPWPLSKSSMRPDCPAWRRSLPSTWTLWPPWSSAASPEKG